MSKSKSSKSVLEREEEYMKINAELEAKTAALVKEADTLLNKSVVQTVPTPLLDEAKMLNDEDAQSSTELNCNSSQQDVPDDTIDFQKKINEISEIMYQKPDNGDVESRKIISNEDDSCFEVQNRYLKAKLRVLQEDNEKLAKDLLKKQEDYGFLQSRIKEIEDERNKLSRNNNSQASQLEKTKKLLDDSKSKIDILESQISALKKEVDQSKRNLDQQNTSNKGNEVRLNRALEESNKFKNQINQMKNSQKDMFEAEKKKMDQLLNENKKLERQKSELMQAFRKQMQLIDVLKRQKMQIEVAKMLQFTEEEFVKALDWEK